MDLKITVLQLMDEGGWVMWALLIFSIAALATAIERSFALRKARTDMGPFLSQLRRSLLTKKSVAEALEVTEATSGPAARVAKTGLSRLSRSSTQLEKSLERRAQGEVRRLHRGLGLLATTAVTAPLLGFLGTVTGMMSSFAILGELGGSNPGLVALGIKEALTTSAAGLVVAVPMQIIHNALAGRVESITGDIEEVASFLIEVREELAT